MSNPDINSAINIQKAMGQINKIILLKILENNYFWLIFLTTNPTAVVSSGVKVSFNPEDSCQNTDDWWKRLK